MQRDESGRQRGHFGINGCFQMWATRFHGLGDPLQPHKFTAATEWGAVSEAIIP